MTSENMKIKFTILLLFVSINYAFSQVNGTVKDGSYVCNRFDWKINIPKNYTLTKVQELETLEKKGNTELKKNLPHNVTIQNIIHLIGFYLDSKNTFSASFTPFNNKEITFEQNEKRNLDLLKQSCSKINNAKFDFKTSNVKIGKYNFHKIKVAGYNASNNQLVITQIYYNSLIKDHLFGVLISYNNEKEGKLLENNFLNSLKK